MHYFVCVVDKIILLYPFWVKKTKKSDFFYVFAFLVMKMKTNGQLYIDFFFFFNIKWRMGKIFPVFTDVLM